MENCLKQFQFEISTARTFSTANSNFTSWTVGTQNYWIAQSAADTSDYTIQGFKNINLYGIKLMGSIQTPLTGPFGIVTDYNWNLKLTGTKPIIGGTFTTNNFNVSLTPLNLRLSKFQSTIMFEEPITSLSQIRISNFGAQGYGNSSLINIRLDLEANFYFLYKFEGEDQEFALL